MFSFEENPVFTVPVTVDLPGSALDSGDNTFRARFSAMTVDEFNGHDLSTPDGVRAFLDEALVGAEDIAVGGRPVAFDAGLKAKLIAAPHIRKALMHAYVSAFEDARRGN